MINRIFIGLILISGLGFAPADKAKNPAASKAPSTVESLILAGKYKDAARMADKTQGAFDEAMTKLLADVDNNILDRKFEETQKILNALEPFLNAYAAVDKAKALPRDAVKGRALRVEGIQLNDKGEYEKAETVLRQALEIGQKTQDPMLEAGIRNNLGYALRNLKKLPEAAKEFGAAAQVAESRKDNLRAGSYNLNLGETQLEQDMPEKALVTFRNAADQNRSAGRPDREARAVFMQATALDQLDMKGGNATILKQILELYKQAEEMYEKLGNERNAALSWYRMADKSSRSKKWDQAAVSGEKALPYYVKAGDRIGQHACYTILADAYKALGKTAKAEQNSKLANDTKEQK
jgi:tetratricopeptide (TPR) repeat protein